VQYCGKNCQKKDWKEHKESCAEPSKKRESALKKEEAKNKTAAAEAAKNLKEELKRPAMRKVGNFTEEEERADDVTEPSSKEVGGKEELTLLENGVASNVPGAHYHLAIQFLHGSEGVERDPVKATGLLKEVKQPNLAPHSYPNPDPNHTEGNGEELTGS